MTSPQIANPGQVWTAGATWLNTYLGNQATQETAVFQNNSNGTLYPGDVVIIGNSTSGSFVADPTVLGVTTTTTASSPLVIGVVGGEVYNPGSSTQTPATVGGGAIPTQLAPTVFKSVTLNSSTTVTDTTASASYLGLEIVGPNIPSGAYITSVTPNTSFTISAAATATGATSVAIQPREGALGPGFPGYPTGELLPVVTRGWAYVNIGGNTVAAGAVLSTSTTARVAAAVAVTTYVASSPGTFIATALEAQSAGIGSPDGSASKIIRAWINKN